MINEPLFPSIRSVYDYLEYGANRSPDFFEYASKHPITSFDVNFGDTQVCTLKVSLFHISKEGADGSEGYLSNSVTAPFIPTYFEESGLTTIRLEDEVWDFRSPSDRDDAVKFLEARNRLAVKAAEDGVSEAREIADRLYCCCGYDLAMVNFTDMIPEVIYTNLDAARALLFFLSVKDRILEKHANLTDNIIEECREFITSDNNLDAYRELKELFLNLGEILCADESVHARLSGAVAYFLYQKHLAYTYHAAWCDTYGEIRAGSVEEYIAECLAFNRVSTDDAFALTALTYCLIKQYEPFSDLDYIHVVVKLYEIVQAEEAKRAKTSFKKQLFANTSTRTTKSRVTIDDVDLMTGEEFENTVAALFREMGYAVSMTKKSGDQGIDVIAKKDSIKIGIQAKCYAQSVGNGAVQEAVAGKAFYNCSKAMVITNSSYTPSAQSLAAANGIVLWDRNVLKQKLKDHPVFS